MMLALASLLMTPACAHERVEHFAPVAPRPAGVPADARPSFSSSVLAGNTAYIAGVTDLDPATRRPGTAPRESIRLVLDALKASVEAAGLEMDDLVWVQVYVTDLDTFSQFNAIYAEYFEGPLPARTFVGVAGLMGGAHFEINGIAVAQACD
jgi:2-iminobutanoate/2-iminopropanoate deaminase